MYSSPRFIRRTFLSLTLLFTAWAMPAAAAAGDWFAQGMRYLYGEGVARDVDTAIVYLCGAARDGSGEAAHELGWLYFQGAVVTRDDALAAAWFAQAAHRGVPTPERTRQSLQGIVSSAAACVGSRGVDLEINDRRRAALAVAIFELSPSFGLDPALVIEVVRAESGFNPRARSPKGALGLMQLIPETAERFRVADRLDPEQNVRGGLAYLRWLLATFDGDIALTAAAYNAGEGAVLRYDGVPPYSETREYVKRVLAFYRSARHILPGPARL